MSEIVTEEFNIDREPFHRAKSGSSAEFSLLMEEYREYLHLIADNELDRNMLPKASASDMVQNTFAEAQEGIGSFNGKTPREFKGWLRQILIRQITDFRRSFKRSKKRDIGREVSLETATDIDTKEFQIQSREPSPSARVLKLERVEQLKEALREIPKAQAAVVIMHDLQGMEWPKIAEHFQRSEVAVRKSYARGIAALRKLVGPDDGA